MTTTYKLNVVIHKKDNDPATTLMEEMLEATAVSITEISDDKDHWNLEAYFLTEPDKAHVRTLLDTLTYSNTSQEQAIRVEEIPDTDWVSVVQSNLKPVQAGDFIIHGSHDRERLASHPLTIEIDAGQAFGTAHHGTTRGCLLAMQHVCKKQRFSNILDLGTGTGILAIGAAKLNKSANIIASDIDKVSTLVAKENCENNGVGQLIDIIHAPGLDDRTLQEKMPFDLLIANILAGPLVQLAPQLAKAVSSGGYIILSGLLRTQTREVTAAYLNQGLSIEKRFPLDEWNTLVLQKR